MYFYLYINSGGNVSSQTGIDTQQLPDRTAMSARIGFEMKRYIRACVFHENHVVIRSEHQPVWPVMVGVHLHFDLCIGGVWVSLAALHA